MVSFLPNYTVTKLHLRICRLSIFLLVLMITSTIQAQNYLEVPIKVDIENGNMDEVMIKVIKNSKTVFSQSSNSKVKLKLNFNCVYTIVFSKPGYISKSVEFNTKATKEHIADGFDPYKIGVKLFKQYDGVNITVYNQPVGKIRFDRDLDEFNYDTDYSKSILSNLQDTEDKLAAIANEEKKTGQMAPVVTESHVAVSMPEPATDNSLIGRSDPVAVYPPEQQDKPPGSAGNSGKDPSKKPTESGADQSKGYLAMDGSNDLGTATTSIEPNNLNATKANGNGSEDGKGNLLGTEGNNSGGAIPEFTETVKITREDIVEKSRIITIVRITKGETTTEYRRVNYHWGGPFYFRNEVANISKNIFVQATGIKD